MSDWTYQSECHVSPVSLTLRLMMRRNRKILPEIDVKSQRRDNASAADKTPYPETNSARSISQKRFDADAA